MYIRLVNEKGFIAKVPMQICQIVKVFFERLCLPKSTFACIFLKTLFKHVSL